MISSMTGFGSAEGKVGTARVSVELRTVNHRFFNPSIKLPALFARWEGEIRELLRQRISRGHVALTARLDRDPSRNGGIDEERFAQYVGVLRTLQEKHSLGSSLDAATILSLPDVVNTGAEIAEDGTAEDLLNIVERALEALRSMRRAEGLRLVSVLVERIAVVEEAVGRIGARAPVRLIEHAARLKKSVRELASGVNVDPQRLAAEIAILADRLDISEEIERFNAHIGAFRQIIAEGDNEPVGKRLGFLLQEMVREANTTGSKASDAAILAEVVTIKEELERIREQVENIE